jgi:integrase
MWVLTAPASAKYPLGDHQISERRLLVALKGIVKKLGLRGHLHTFRHAFISRALTSGIPEAVVRAWVGHVDPDVIRLYTHIADADSQAAMRRLNASSDT